MALSPRESAEYIANRSKHVSISKAGVEKAAELIIKGFKEEKFSFKCWKENEMNPQENKIPSTIDWIFLADTLNFSFWSEKEKKYQVTFHGKTYTGYWSLCAAINRAIEEGYAITLPSFYSTISMDTLRHIFRSDSGIEMPMLAERQKILNETGKCLIEKFEGSFTNCIDLCKNKATTLLQIIVDNFPSYRDEATFEGQKVSFYKRAQILIGDIWACFEGQGYGAFEDIDSITIFADYRIPQVLVHFGAMIYTEELLQALKEGKEMKNGDQYEVEIRGCSIWVVELIKENMKTKQKEGKLDRNIFFNSILIDHYIWEYRRKYAEEMEVTPYHKVRCIYY